MQTNANIKRIAAVVLFTFGLQGMNPLWAGNKLINVQGKLTDAQGNALTGSHVVSFRLYANTNDPLTSAVWTESQGVTVQSGGLVSVSLGHANSLDAVPFNTPYYLGMQVAGDNNELSPRQLIGASAYALGSLGDFNAAGSVSATGNVSAGGNVTAVGNISANSMTLNNKDVGGYLLPPGTVLTYAGTSAPAGFLICNGASVSRVTYAELFQAIGTAWGPGDGSTTFNIPDLRRRTTVGSGGTGTSALGNAVGNVGGEEKHTQSVAEMPAHAHSINDPGHSHTLHEAFDNAPMSNRIPYGARGIGATFESGHIGTSATGISVNNTGSGTAFNVMQPSAVVNYMIKY